MTLSALTLGVQHFRPPAPVTAGDAVAPGEDAVGQPVIGEPATGSPVWQELAFVADVLPRMTAALRGLGYDVREELNPDADGVRRLVPSALKDGARVLYAVSHGAIGGSDRDRVDLVPSCTQYGIGTSVGGWAGDIQARRQPVLLLLDLCHSGRVARLPFLTAGPSTYAWVIAAAGADEYAFDGKFSSVVAEVLEELALTGLGADSSRRYVAFSVVARHIGMRMRALPGLPQRVHSTPLDAAMEEPELPFFPNPRFVDNPAREVRQRIEPPVRAFLDDLDELSTEPLPHDADHFVDRTGSHFAGRRRQLRTLAAWLDDPGAGRLRVVTGSPGIGKSALLGALVCAAHPRLNEAAPGVRIRLQAQDPAGCPSPNDRLAAIHARQRGVTELAASLARQVGLTEPPDGWTETGLINALAELDEPPVAVVDALDEAVDPAGVADRLLLPLATATRQDGRPVCRLLVGMRPWPEFQSLAELAEGQQGLVDLDLVTPEEQRDDLAAHLLSHLASLVPYAPAEMRLARERLAETVADRLTAPADAPRTWGPFLVATIFMRYLAGLPTPATEQQAVRLGATAPTDLPGVLNLDLDVTEGENGAGVRAVLTAVAHAKGDGMPEELITPLAAAIDPTATSTELAGALNRCQFYLRTGLDADGTTLYRLFHQGLADHLRQRPRGRLQDAAFAPGDVLDALLAPWSTEGAVAWADTPAYLRRHAVQHALEAGCGDQLIESADYLVHATPETLLAALDDAESVAARLSAAVYRTSIALHRTAAPGVRRWLLSLDAARYGAVELLAALTDPVPARSWVPKWATGSQISTALRHTLSGHDGGVPAVACTVVDGRPTAVTGGQDGTVRRWDLATGHPVRAPMVGAPRSGDGRVLHPSRLRATAGSHRRGGRHGTHLEVGVLPTAYGVRRTPRQSMGGRPHCP